MLQKCQRREVFAKCVEETRIYELHNAKKPVPGATLHWEKTTSIGWYWKSQHKQPMLVRQASSISLLLSFSLFLSLHSFLFLLSLTTFLSLSPLFSLLFSISSYWTLLFFLLPAASGRWVRRTAWPPISLFGFIKPHRLNFHLFAKSHWNENGWVSYLMIIVHLSQLIRRPLSTINSATGQCSSSHSDDLPPRARSYACSRCVSGKRFGGRGTPHTYKHATYTRTHNLHTYPTTHTQTNTHMHINTRMHARTYAHRDARAYTCTHNTETHRTV